MKTKENIYNEMFINAAKQKNLRKIKILLTKGVDIDYHDKETEMTALIIACSEADGINYEIVKHLIDNGAKLNESDNYWYTALMTACSLRKGINPEIVKYLVDNGAELNCHDIIQEYSALMFACVNKQLSIVEYLIEKGAFINTQDDMGFTALFNAALRDNIEMVDLLILKGADVTIKNEYQYTVLKWCKENNKSLLEHITSKIIEIDHLKAFGLIDYLSPEQKEKYAEL